jgi:pimeloyl-ACP methyl ester carboxylesterase
MKTYQKRRLSTRPGLVAAYLLLLSLCIQLAGCGSHYSVKTRSATELFQKYDRSALDSSKPSWRTTQQLRRLFLDREFKKDPLDVIETLCEKAYREDDRSLMVACAELSLLQAKKRGRKEMSDEAMTLYVKAAELAYDYLFASESFNAQNVITPSYRFVAEIYNQSISNLMEARGQRNDPWLDTYSRTLGNTTYDVTVERNSPNAWNPSIFDSFRPTHRLQIKGIKNRYVEKGLGAPLVGFIDKPLEHTELGEYHPSDGVAYPLTVVMSFGPRDQGEGPVSRKASLVFYDTMVTKYASIEGQQVPLEADYSTPLGVLLSRVKGKSAGFTGMLNSDKHAKTEGIYMLEPLRKDKIPVIMVHGLMSSPGTWMEMFNDLRGTSELREHYQFWFFQYPTGYPVGYSSSILRKQLLDIWGKADPDHENPYFNQAVLIGHSMGGMISHIMMQDSQDAYWESTFSEPIETIQLSDDDKALVKEIFYFEHLPFVKRVIFIATPHRGSQMADKWYSKLGSSMIHLPDTFDRTASSLFKLGQDKFVVNIEKYSKRTNNSMDSLSPSSHIVEMMNEVPMQPDIPYHSIIGVRNSDAGPGSSDGIVPYESSHLDIAVTETLVPSGHSAHMHPYAISEVERILFEHLETASLK